MIQGEFVDIEWPDLWEVKYSKQKDKGGYVHDVINNWRMISVTFMRAKQAASTDLIIYFDQRPPQKARIEGVIYQNNPLSSTFVGLNFAGILKSLTIFTKIYYISKFGPISSTTA